MPVIMRAIGIGALLWFLSTISLAFTDNDYVWGLWMILNTLLLSMITLAIIIMMLNKSPYIFEED